MSLFSSYEKFSKSSPADGALLAFRQAGFDYAQNKGLPSRKDEDWHYTSVKVLGESEFTPSTAEGFLPPHELFVEVKKYLHADFTNFVFFNGVFNHTLSDQAPKEVKITPSSQWATEFADVFDALNGAYLTQAWDVEIPAETSVEKPVNFVFFTANSDGLSTMVHPRLNIKVGKRSSVRFLESYYGSAVAAYFVNPVTSLRVAESAKVTYVRLQNEAKTGFNIGRTNISLEGNAHLESLSYSTGARLARHSLNVELIGAGSHSEILGLYAVSGDQHVDNTTVIDHAVGACDSNQLYKGILDGESRAVFNGKVLIRKDAQKANSAQLNNNLLLSQKAEADSKPNLEIHADDVKASHGSTVGQLNAEEVFYLQSRAIPKEKAIPMLSYGYLSEVIYKISDETIQRWLTRHLDEAFKDLSVMPQTSAK